MIKNKPYLWLDTAGNRLLLKMKLECDPNYGLRTNQPYQEIDGDTLRLLYTVEPNYPVPDPLEFDLSDHNISQYNPDTHARVTVLIIDTGRRILGQCTVKPRLGIFENSSLQESIRPYLYLDYEDSTQSLIHMYAVVDNASGLNEFNPAFVNDFNDFTRTISYEVIGGAGQRVIETTHALTKDDFDPVLDKLVVSLVEYDPNNNIVEKRRGSGTVHTSEADASSDS